MKVGICTLGCKVNTYESEYIISLFKNHNYEICDFNEICDIYVINTCTVTNNSDSKSRKMINHARKLNKDACLVVCGCFVESAKDYDFKDVDIVIGNYNKSKVVELVEEFLSNKKQIKIENNIMTSPFEDMFITNYYSHTRAFVKIQDGCENYCSYCIIPFVRGRCRSKDKDKVINEITTLVNNGFKEIVLTGIHTGNYGVDLGIKFSSLLKEILNIKNLERLRISSIEITELDEEFFKLLENNTICDHLHIPLQSGSDKILKLMNRKYDKRYFLNIINKIRSVRPDISITTDVIVGFPEETEEDFLECLEFIKEVNFSKIHVFPYSKRDGTKAAKMNNQVNGIIKKDRVKRLISLSEKLELSYRNKFINKNMDVLIEKSENSISFGHTSNYLYLRINKELEENNIVNICLEEDIFN